jgi:hypothetical protein
MTLTTEKIKAWRELASRATPGPWTANRRQCETGYVEGKDLNGGIIECSRGSDSKPNAEFIAAARTAVPELCDEVERLQSGYLRFEKACRELVSNAYKLEFDRDKDRKVLQTKLDEAIEVLERIKAASFALRKLNEERR